MNVVFDTFLPSSSQFVNAYTVVLEAICFEEGNAGKLTIALTVGNSAIYFANRTVSSFRPQNIASTSAFLQRYFTT